MSERLLVAHAIATARYHGTSQYESYDEAILATAREIETYAGYAHLGLAHALELKLLRPRYLRHHLVSVLYKSEAEVAREAFQLKPSEADARILLQLGFLQVICRVLTLVLAQDSYPMHELHHIQCDLRNVQDRYGELASQLKDPPTHLRLVCSSSPLQTTRSMPDLIEFAAQSGAQWRTPGRSTTPPPDGSGRGDSSPRPRRLSPAPASDPLASVMHHEAIARLTAVSSSEKKALSVAVRDAQVRMRPRSTQRTRSAEAVPLAPLTMHQPAYALTAFVADAWFALEHNRSLPSRLIPRHTSSDGVTCLARQYLTLRALCGATSLFLDRSLSDTTAYLPPILHAHAALVAKARVAAKRMLEEAPESLRGRCFPAAHEIHILRVLVDELLKRAESYKTAYQNAHVRGNVMAIDRLHRDIPDRASWTLNLSTEDGQRRYAELYVVLELVQRIVHGAESRLRYHLVERGALPEQVKWHRPAAQQLNVPCTGRSRRVSLGHMRPRATIILPSTPIPIPVRQRRATAKFCKLESPPRIWTDTHDA